MITLSKNGNSVTFTFDENSGYLQNGTIDVPVNSLSLVIDDSDMATFRKSASNDIFVSARYADFGMTKAELEAWYKANMVGSTGGGGGGTVSSAVTSGDTNAVAGGAVYDQVTIGGGMEVISSVTISSSYSSVVMPDCDKFTISAGTAVGDTLTSGGKVINVYDKSTDTFVFSSNTVSDMSSNYVTVEGTTADTSITLTAVDGYYFKGNNSMMFKSNYSGGWVVTFYKNADAEWLKNVVSANTIAIEGKQDTLVSGTNIKTINNTSLLGSGNIDIQGGGKAIEAGRGISITTGATADTVSINLPISAGTGTNSIKEGYGTTASGNSSHAEGSGTTASGSYSHAEGHSTIAKGNNGSHAEGSNTQANSSYSHAEGYFTKATNSSSHAEGYMTTASGMYSHAEGYDTETKNEAEHASGRYNWSKKATNDFGHSGNTLFSVGNGAYYGGEGVLHNAIDIRQNGDIYIVDTSSSGEYFDKQMIKLQDSLGGTVSSAITSGDTNAVAGGAVYSKFDEIEQVTAAALNNLNDKFGGLKLEKLTQAQYDALVTKDASTLYIIVN